MPTASARGGARHHRASEWLENARGVLGLLHGKLASVTRLLACGAALLFACGSEPPDAPEDLLVRLRGIPGVTVEEQTTSTPGVTYFVLHFTQPVDHEAPDGQT